MKNLIAVTGYKGRLGRELVDNWGCEPFVCDITDPNQIVDSFHRLSPDIIINCAAYTAVDLCEKEAELKKAALVNFRGVEILRRHFPKRLIHISTDYIFDGTKGPYSEKARPNPVNAYGFTKLLGEEVLRTSPYPGQSFIVRTTGLYGGSSGRPDFASLIVDKAHNKENLYAVNNLSGNQTYIPHLCEALINLANMEWKYGFDVVHIASSDVVSRYEFALMLGNAVETEYVRSHVHPVKSRDITTWTAKRPVKGGLSVNKAVKLGLPVFTIYQGIKAYKKWLTKI